MKKTLAILLIAVWCEDSTHGEQPVESITNTIGMKFKLIPAGTHAYELFPLLIKSPLDY